MKSSDQASVVFRFIKNPEFVKLGARILFRSVIRGLLLASWLGGEFCDWSASLASFPGAHQESEVRQAWRQDSLQVSDSRALIGQLAEKEHCDWFSSLRHLLVHRASG
jgi:hypothetical protein